MKYRNPKLALVTAFTFATVSVMSSISPSMAADPALDKAAIIKSFGGDALIAAAQKEGSLVLYTSIDVDSIAIMVAEFKKTFPGIAVEVFRQGGGALDLVVRAESKAGKLRADVIEQTDAYFMSQLDSQLGLLAEYKPPRTLAYLSSAIVNGKIYPGYSQLFGYAYNTNLVAAADVPKSWNDFLNPKFNKSRGTIPPTAGGCSWALAYFERQVLGVKFWKKLAATKPTLLNSNTLLIQMLSKGDIAISTMLDNVARPAIKAGAPIKMVYPTEGTPPCPVSVALVKNAPHKAAGTLWLNWLLSTSGQSVWVNQVGAVSARTDMPLPAGVAGLNAWKMPMSRYLSLHEDWIAEWLKMFNYRAGA